MWQDGPGQFSEDSQIWDGTLQVKFVTSRLRRRRLRQQADLALEYGWGAEDELRVVQQIAANLLKICISI